MQRVIRLPNGKVCTIGTYVKSWRILLRSKPDSTVGGFDHFPTDAASVLRDLRAGMHERINRHDARYGKGRKWDSDWQRGAMQCAHAVNTPRLIVRWVPPDFRARLAHRIARHDDL